MSEDGGMPGDSDQQGLWNKAHAERIHESVSQPSEFAREVANALPEGSQMLELGCGVGTDAAFFASLGHNVIATDFSEVVIGQDRERYTGIPNLKFLQADTSKPLPVDNSSLDGVYANLSLHYFKDAQTRQIFQEIADKIKPDGILAFTCKSTEDPLYGQGEELEENMYRLQGHDRHFFNEAYARSVLGNMFEVKTMRTRKIDRLGKQSSTVEVIAQRKTAPLSTASAPIR